MTASSACVRVKQACVAANCTNADLWKTFVVATRGAGRFAGWSSRNSLGPPLPQGLEHTVLGNRWAHKLANLGREMHGVSEETFKAARERRSTFDTAAKWTDHSAHLRAQKAGQQTGKTPRTHPKLTPEERRALFRARCPGTKRHSEPRTRHVLGQIWPQGVRCTLCNLQAVTKKGMKLFRQARCRSLRDTLVSGAG